MIDHLAERIERTRRDESILLTVAGLFVFGGFVLLGLVRHEQMLFEDVAPALAWALIMLMAHLALERYVPFRDPLLLPIAALLTGWGLMLVARLQPQLTWSHVERIGIGVAALVALTAFTRQPASGELGPHGGLRWLKRYRYTWLVIALALLAATFVLGVNPLGRGLRLWLQAGDLYLQPSELLKLPVLVYLASYLSEHRGVLTGGQRTPLLDRERMPYFLPLVATWTLSLVLLVLQRDLGSASLFFVVFLAMLYLATEDLTYLIGGGVLLLASGVAGYFLYSVVALRVDIWWNPWPEAQGNAFQIVQSLYAVASGGLIGQGLGQGAPGYVPAAYTDFPFAAIAEEFGLTGAFALLMCYALLIVRAARAATLAQDAFQTLLAAGIGLLFGLQSLIIVGGNLRVIPLTGITLPFVSYGGSSLLASFLMLALLLRISAREEP